MVVREMILTDEPVYSNIITRKVDNNILISKEDIMKREVISVKKDGTEVCKFSLNEDYWREQRDAHECINVIIDEAHTLINPRRAMSKESVVMTDFMALLRRILGSSDGGGELILITQLERRLDVIAREMATLVQYVICHYTRTCKNHGAVAQETNETPNKMVRCTTCGCKTKREKFIIEVFSFQNIEDYHAWDGARKVGGWRKTYFQRYTINDIETVFSNYDTLQWDNLLSD